MKKLFRPLILAIFTLFAVACSKDGSIDTGSGTSGGGNGLSFTLNGFRSTQGITYADRIATEAEDAIATLDIYMFEYKADGTGDFIEKFSFTDADLKPVGANKVVTLGPLSKATYGDTKKIYYFVGNASPTTSLDATLLTENDFRDALTEVLDYSTDELKRPLLFSGKSAPMGIVGSGTVELMRRVARFDIVNDYKDELTITAVTVAGAATSSHVFQNNTGAGTIANSTDDYEVAMVGGLTYVEKLNTAGTKDEWIAESIFYLYPTQIPAKTKITVEGIYNSESFVYHINTDTDIKANYRYKLIATAGALVTFNLVTLDWFEGGDVDLGFLDDLEIASIDEGRGRFDADDFTYYVRRNETNIFEFEATVGSTYGAEQTGPIVFADGNGGGAANFTLTPGAVSAAPTYANGKTFKQTFTLKVEGVTEAFIAELNLADLVGTDAKAKINIICEPISYVLGQVKETKTVGKLMKYDGFDVTELGQFGDNTNNVYACDMAILGDYIYVSGYENLPTARTAPRLWKYEMASGTSTLIDLPYTLKDAISVSIGVMGNDIYMSGYESENMNKYKGRMWKYDGTNVTSIVLQESTQNLQVPGLVVYGNDVYGIGFETVDYPPLESAARMWKYDGSSVTRIDLGDGADYSIAYDAAGWGDDVYAVGYRVLDAGDVIGQLWKWDGSAVTTTDLDDPLLSGSMAGNIMMNDNQLYISSSWSDGIIPQTGMIRKYDGTTFSEFPIYDGEHKSSVSEMAVYGNTTYVYGYISKTGIQNTMGLWRWKGDKFKWTAFTDGTKRSLSQTAIQVK